MKTQIQTQPQTERNRKEPNFEIRASFSPQSYNEEERSVEIVLSTEKAYMRYSWWEDKYYDEVLPVRGAYFPEKLPLLDSHKRSETKNVLGSIVNIRIEGDSLVGKARFAETEEAEKARKLVRDGHLTDISIGYSIEAFTKILPGNSFLFSEREYKAEAREIELATKYRIFEGSLTPIGANDEAKVRSLQTGEKTMGEENKTTSQEPNITIDIEKVRAEAAEKERTRISEITSLCRTFDTDASEYIKAGTFVENVRNDIFESERKRRMSKTPTAEPTITNDAVDKTKEYIENSLSLRMRMPLPHEKIEANYRSLVDLAREYLRSKQIDVRYMDNIRIAKMAMQRAFSHSTSDFPNLFANTLTRRLQRAYQLAPSTYEMWCNIVDVPDFKEQTIIKMSEGEDLELIAEGGKYPETTFSEKTESYTLQKYGKIFAITWEAIINDDLRFFDRLAELHGFRARRKPNALAYAILTANAAMGEDAVALFHADHNNLGSAALAYDSLSASRTKMRKQTGLDGTELNLNPEFLIVPPDLETTADELTNSLTKPSATWNSTNVLAGKFKPVVEAILASSSTTAWYLAASPAQIDTVEVAFLQGYREPVLEEEAGFDIDGRKYKVMLPCVAKAIDYRGLQKGNA